MTLAARRISCELTILYRLFAAGLMGSATIATLFVVWLSTSGVLEKTSALGFALAVCSIAYMLGIRLKDVYQEGDELVIAGVRRRIRVPLAEVTEVSSSLLSNPEVVTLRFRQTTAFGRKVAFAAPLVLFGPRPHPIVNELRTAVHEAQRAAEQGDEADKA